MIYTELDTDQLYWYTLNFLRVELNRYNILTFAEAVKSDYIRLINGHKSGKCRNGHHYK